MLCVPALFALHSVGGPIVPRRAQVASGPPQESLHHVLWDRRLLAYLACTMLFQATNAPMLPMAAVEITKRIDKDASLVIAACILVPQVMVAVLSPLAGRAADRWGRRWVLLAGFYALPARALLLSVVTDPTWIVPVQALDGFGGAALGVMTPLIAADLAGVGGRFNLRMGIIGLASGVAATLSYTVAGWIATNLGTPTAFIALEFTGVIAVLTVALAMPETRPLAPATRSAGIEPVIG
jgi:MFS family permease